MDYIMKVLMYYAARGNTIAKMIIVEAYEGEELTNFDRLYIEKLVNAYEGKLVV